MHTKRIKKIHALHEEWSTRLFQAGKHPPQVLLKNANAKEILFSIQFSITLFILLPHALVKDDRSFDPSPLPRQPCCMRVVSSTVPKRITALLREIIFNGFACCSRTLFRSMINKEILRKLFSLLLRNELTGIAICGFTSIRQILGVTQLLYRTKIDNLIWPVANV